MRRKVRIHESEMEDLRAVAEIEGLTEDEAIALFGWQTEFCELMEEVEGRYGDRISDSAINPDRLADQHPCGFIRFVGKVPEDLAATFEEFPVPIVLEGGAPYTRAQRGRLSSLAMTIFLREIDTLSGHCGMDSETETIEALLQVGDPDSVDVPIVVEAAREAIRAAHPSLDVPPIELTLTRHVAARALPGPASP